MIPVHNLLLNLRRFSSFVLLLAALALPLAAQTLYAPGGTSAIGSSSNGNVGIGTNSPTNKLTILKSSGGSGYGGTDGTGGVRIAWTTGYGVSMDAWDGSAPHWGIVKFIENTPMVVMEGDYWNNNVLFNSGGNVGIGTTSPLQALDVSGAIRSVVASGSNIFLSKTSGASIAFDNGAGVPTALIESGSPSNANRLEFWTNSSANTGLVERMRIDNAGNVGIGTVNPDVRLHITDAANPNTGTIRLGSTAYHLDLQHDSITTGYAVLNDTHGGSGLGGFIFKGDGTERVRIQTATGNVGIGTANPTQKLSVNGTIRAKEVIVDTGWSDYVFEDGYKLKALSEVEAFVKAEKHLPGIPSAKEVAENGVSVGEMQSKLLAKIEELTLHQIALEKENRALRTRVTALEQR